MERANLQHKLAAAARHEEPVWTLDCLEPDALVALIEEGAITDSSRAQMAHVASCAYCSHAFDEMEQTLQLAAKARELQAPASVLIPTASEPAFEENRPERKEVVPWWRWLLGPSLGFALGAAAVTLFLYSVSVRPLKMQEAKLHSQASELRSQVAQLNQVTEENTTQSRGNVEKLRKEKEELQQKAAQGQMRIASLETRIAQLTRSANDNRLALDALQHAAATTEQALNVMSEVQRSAPPPEKSAVRLLHPVANVLLSNRITFRWESADNATGYQLVVLDAGSKQVAKSSLLSTTEWTTTLPPSP